MVWTDLEGNISSNSGYANEYRDRNGYTNSDGRLALGPWQGIYLWEHRRQPTPREVVVTLLGA